MISKEEVLKISKLARLEMTSKETEKMQKDLSSILDYFNLLKEAGSLSKESLKNYKVLDVAEASRKDMVDEELSKKAVDIINLFPEKEKGYIKVRQVL